MRKTDRRTPILLAAAAFLAAAFFPPFAASQETSQKAEPRQPAVSRAGRLTELGLSPDQVKALEAFREARMDERRLFREEMATLRGEMRELRKDPQANLAKIEALIDKQAGLRAEREKGALRARAEKDKIFTPAQLEKLRSLRDRRVGRGRLSDRGLSSRSRIGRGPGGHILERRIAARRPARPRALRHRPLLRRHRWSD